MTIGVAMEAFASSGVEPELRTISLKVALFAGRRVSDIPKAWE